MTIDDLIRELTKLKEKHGNLPVKVQTLSHVWEPDITVRSTSPSKKTAYVLLNS